jgi:small basic protein
MRLPWLIFKIIGSFQVNLLVTLNALALLATGQQELEAFFDQQFKKQLFRKGFATNTVVSLLELVFFS